MNKLINSAINKCIDLAYEQKLKHHFTNHIFVSAIISNNKNVIYGLNVPKSGIICSEMVALGQALLIDKSIDLLYIITISLDKNNKPYIANMCGNCRQNLYYVCPHIKTILGYPDNYYTVSLSDLLPYPHTKDTSEK